MIFNPFHIQGPAVISFSGGRTSGYMLRRILDEGLRPDVHVLFADTGKERQETYDFVRACAERWGVAIHWVWRDAGNKETPFDKLIADRGFLPNPVARFCTTELKIRPMKEWMRARGYDHWTNVVGIRADEPRRVAKMRASEETRPERWDVALPLADAGVALAEVTAFWERQPFDLRLRPWEGNCDLCFLKATRKRRRIMRDKPDLAEWWINHERMMGATFRADAPSYAGLLDAEVRQLRLFDDEDLADCICHEGTCEVAA